MRIKHRSDFQRLYRKGVRVSGRHVVLFVARGEGRFGVTASRKVGSAVRRSRCRRRLRELYRLHRASARGGPWDVVANARGSCAFAAWGELENDFVTALHRAIVAAEDTQPHQVEPRM